MAGTVTATFAAIELLAAKTIPDLAVLLSPDVDALAQLLVAVRRASAQLKWADEQLEDELVKAMPGKDVEVPGVGVITLRTGTKRTQWQHDDLFAAIGSRIADDPTILVDVDTGEKLPPQQTVERVVALVREAVTPSWKVTGIRRYGLSPDDFCDTTWGRKQIQTPTIDVTDLFTKDSD